MLPRTFEAAVSRTNQDSFVETGMVHTGRAIGEEPVVLLYAGLFTAGEPLTTCVEDGTPTP